MRWSEATETTCGFAKVVFFSVEIASHEGQGGFSLELMNRGVMFAVSLVS